MAKVKFNASAAAAATNRAVEEVLTSKRLEEAMGKVIIDRISLEARRGTPLNDDRSFPALKPGTIKRRQELARKNKTHPAFSPERSNLTFTGQLIDALTFRRSFGLVFDLFVDDTTRTPYRGSKDTGRKTDQQVDDDLRSGVGDPRRKFELFTKKGIEKERKIIDRITELIKGELKRRL